MVEELLTDTKFIVVSKRLANRVKVVAGRLGFNVTAFTTDALTQALRIDEMGTNLKDAVDLYRLMDVHRGAGRLSIMYSNFKGLVGSLTKKQKKELSSLWLESGKWYGAYLSARLNGDALFDFLERDLLITWGLDAVEIEEQDVEVSIRCTSFGMGDDVTGLLHLYIVGLMTELGYSKQDEDVLRGLLQLQFLKTLK